MPRIISLNTMDERTLYTKLVEKHIAAVEAEVKGVRLGQDIEHLHRMRVDLRRLKSTLADFKETVNSREYQAAILNIKRLLRSLGQARDIDTKISYLTQLAAGPVTEPAGGKTAPGLKYREGIFEIIDELREDRAEIQPRILKDLSRLHQHQVFKSIRRLKPTLAETGVTLDEWAKNNILERLEKMFSLEPYVRQAACVKELHEMRIAAKNLRYTLENFECLYGNKVKPFIFAAMKVQRALGDMHNFDIWLGLIKIFKDSSGRDVYFRRAVNFLHEECTLRRAEAYQDFLLIWSRLKKQKTWARLSYFTLDRP
ncbi:MAG: CHAD domain-containing protein [Candidatus Omnitrophica bacterium]|nr:CHAD domain-containing protein [Candidatus Omnitrophota bacterium]